jgi:hypothetical protein
MTHRQNWIFVATLKSNRLVSLDKSTGYQGLQRLTFEPQHWAAGVLVKLKE